MTNAQTDFGPFNHPDGVGNAIYAEQVETNVKVLRDLPSRPVFLIAITQGFVCDPEVFTQVKPLTCSQ